MEHRSNWSFNLSSSCGVGVGIKVNPFSKSFNCVSDGLKSLHRTHTFPITLCFNFWSLTLVAEGDWSLTPQPSVGASPWLWALSSAPHHSLCQTGNMEEAPLWCSYSQCEYSVTSNWFVLLLVRCLNS